MIRSLRDEALLMLEGRGAILDVAREATELLHRASIECAVIGGVAVVLHGHVRTTVDVDVLVESTDGAAKAMKEAGFTFHRTRREFRRGGVPLHLVLIEQLRKPPAESVNIDGIRTVGLADLINMKLDLGLRDPLRAQDLADVIGLIRARRLTTTFAGKLDKSLRGEFRKLVRLTRESL